MGKHFEIPRRRAMEREELVVHRFPSGTVGLTSRSDLRAAGLEQNRTAGKRFSGRIKDFFAAPQGPPIASICVAPGTLLIVKDIPPRLQRKWAIWSEEGAIFVWTKAAANSDCDTMRGTRNGLQTLTAQRL